MTVHLVQQSVPVTQSGRRWHRLRLPGAVLAGSLVAVAYVAQVDPNQPGHYPVCPTLALAGIYCPGCGMLRATHDLATGDLAGAMARNPLAIPIYAAMLAVFVLWVVRRWKGRVLVWTPPSWLPGVMAAGFVAYTIARNIPGWTWLSPA